MRAAFPLCGTGGCPVAAATIDCPHQQGPAAPPSRYSATHVPEWRVRFLGGLGRKGGIFETSVKDLRQRGFQNATVSPSLPIPL